MSIINNKLFYIKLIHTVIWLFFVFIIGYILYAGVVDKIDIYLLVAIGFLVLEGIILIVFRGKCPVTIIGYNYAENKEPGFDIFLPKWLAINNKKIFGAISIMGVIIVIYRLVGN